MTEPTYNFIKGIGWVPSVAREGTFFWGHFKINVEQRAPERHEQYLSSNYDFDDFNMWFKNAYNWLYRTYPSERELDEVILKPGTAFVGLINKHFVYTIKIERL